jgi:hypothetical protein
VFVGCNYSREPVKNFRSAFDGVMAEKDDVHFIFADQHITSNSLLDKIQYEIAACDYGLFDITFWNPNVLLEFGIAVGKSKDWHILFNPYADATTLDKFLGLSSPAKVPLILQGHDILIYNSLVELQKKLNEWVAKTIARAPPTASRRWSQLRLQVKQVVERTPGVTRNDLQRLVPDREMSEIKWALDHLERNGVVRKTGAGLGIRYYPAHAQANHTATLAPAPRG